MMKATDTDRPLQINPPFDGSPPCPACQQQVRGLGASIHNFLTRCKPDGSGIEQGKAMIRIWDMRTFSEIPTELTVPHPASIEIVAVARALIEASGGMTSEGATVRWSPETLARIEALIPRAMAAADGFAPLSEAHFADYRHCSGEPNVLRARKGMSWAGFVKPDYERAKYDYPVWVEIGDGHFDIEHRVCGVRLRLHQHFLDHMQRDPTFYGQVWCPSCRINAPAEQFVRHHHAD